MSSIIQLNRRSLILTGLAAAGAAIATQAISVTPPPVPFALGVASGDPSDDGFVIWTRLVVDPLAPDGLGGVTGPTNVRWEVSADEQFSSITQRGEITTHSASAHTIHVELGGLKPHRQYWYRFTALGVQSPVGRARTLPRPEADVSGLSLAFVSCSHWELGWFSAYRHLAAERPDLVLLLGDYIYEYSYTGRRAERAVRRHGRPGEVTTLAGYRNRYALYRTDPDLQALHACAPCLMTWDDHEVENDYGGGLPQDVAEDGGFARRRMAAYQAYFEHMPLRRASRPTRTEMRLYKRFRFGRLAEISMLDGRQYRSAPACPTPQSRRARVVGDDCLERLDPSRTMLGQRQERWLYDGFRSSEARWNIIGQDLLAASLRQKGPAGLVGHWTDGWDGYPATRDRMLAAMQRTRLSNPVLLSGDIHSYWATDLKADFRNPESRTVATEFVGAGVTADGPPYDDFAAMLPENPHVKYFESRRHGYVRVDVHRDRLEARFRAVSDRTDPAATVETLAAFTVNDGFPGAILA